MVHLCFVAFFVSNSREFHVYSGIACFALILAGSFHHLLTILATTIRKLYQYSTLNKKTNQVQPDIPRSAKIKKEHLDLAKNITAHNLAHMFRFKLPKISEYGKKNIAERESRFKSKQKKVIKRSK